MIETRAGRHFISVPSLVGLALLGVALAPGCGGSGSDTGGSGGAATGSGGDHGAGSGGALGTGGGPAGTGGRASSGGTPGTGGVASSSGGATASGGVTSSSGGTPGSGGLASSGGSTGSGGVTSQGGSTGAAGRTSAGGSTGAAGRSSAGGSTGAAGHVAGGAAGHSSTGGSGGVGGGGVGAGGSNGGMPSGVGVCDIFASGNTPCVAAHSTVRALYGAYTGSLYQVTRASDKTMKDIGVLSPGGFADAAAQDTFCAGTTCTVSIIYDQSGKNNHLTQGPPGQRKATPDTLADAAALKLTISGHTVYGLHLPPGYGYRNDKTTGVATGDQPETEYMVTSGTYFNGNCCWDYGNAETNNYDDGAGTMEAVYFGNYTHQGKGGGTGPWVMADMENGVFAGPSFAANPMVTPLTSEYVTAMVIGRAGSFALRGGNAQMGTVTTMYDGMRANGYNPMKKQGAIILGIGGDNTAGGQGNFYEGVLTSGAASEATTNAVQANIVAAGYGK